jgi:putative MATE family efflux protein
LSGPPAATGASSARVAGNLTRGPLGGHVARLSGFMILGFLAMTLAQLVEAIYLGLVGSAELAAVAFTFPIVMAFNAVTRGIGIGTGAVLARAIGAGDSESAARVTSHGLVLTLVFTIAVGALVALLARPLFGAIGARDDVLDLTVAYMTIWCIGFPAFGLSMVGAGLMRSIGDAAFPGWVLTFGSLAQVALGPWLIFGGAGVPALGIEGAAWAFVIARASSCVMTLWWFAVKQRMLRVDGRGFAASTRTILHVGVPAGTSNLIQPASMAITTWLLAGYGTTVVAGFGAASRIEAVVNMVVIGISASAAPLVGQNWGAGEYARVEAALAVIYRACHVWGLAAAALMWIMGAWFAGLVSDDPEVVATATLYLWIVPLSIGFTGMVNVANASFNALSRPWPPLVLSLARMLIVYVPLALWASAAFGWQGVFVVTALVNIGFGIAGWWWNRVSIKSLRPHPSTAPA